MVAAKKKMNYAELNMLLLYVFNFSFKASGEQKAR
jgi:hypothetical protein